MSALEVASVFCQLRAYFHGEFTDESMAALDRLFNNVSLLEQPTDSPNVDEAINAVGSYAQRYAIEHIDQHVNALKMLRDTDSATDTPCKLVDTFLALDKLDRTLDVLVQDNANGTVNAANRVAALEAAGKAINSVGNLMGSSTVLAGFGEFLVEFVEQAWIPLTSALNVYFKRLQWISNYDPNTGEILGPQPG